MTNVNIFLTVWVFCRAIYFEFRLVTALNFVHLTAVDATLRFRTHFYKAIVGTAKQWWHYIAAKFPSSQGMLLFLKNPPFHLFDSDTIYFNEFKHGFTTGICFLPDCY